MVGVLNEIAKFLFPPKCIFCRRVLEKDGVCKRCKSTLPYKRPQEVKEKILFVDKAFSCFYYEGDVKNAIIRYKFGGISKYSVDFSEYIAECIKSNLSGEYDIISWVPLSKKRQKSRGYDQARLLATETCARLDDTIRAEAVLGKIRDTSPQSRQNDVSKRMANVLGAYGIMSDNVKGKRIILIDDVLTTGSTVGECARVLKMAGASAVYIVTLASTRNRKK